MFFFQPFVDQRALGGLSCVRWGAQRGVLLVWSDEWRGLPQRVVVVTRPRVVGGAVGHLCSDGIELDVAVARQQIAVGVDQRGLEALFPQRTGARVACVEAADVAAADGLHHARDAAGGCLGGEKVDVICHQHISVNSAVVFG
jgi:hypothetical protein